MLLLYEVFFSALVEQYALLIQPPPLREPWFVCDSTSHNACLVIASACSWENLTQKTDWHCVNGVCVSLLKRCTTAEARAHTCLRASPSPGCRHKGCQPLTALQCTAFFQRSGLQRGKNYRCYSEVSNFTGFPGFYFRFKNKLDYVYMCV